MCLICVDLKKGVLKAKEARNNLDELSENMALDHYFEVLGLIWDKESEEDDEISTNTMD
jgi:hypothetical protein